MTRQNAKNPDLNIPPNCMNFNLRRTTRAITKLYDAALKPAGITSTQFTMLVAIAPPKPGSMQDLAQTLGMDRTTLTRNLHPLERAGLVKIIAGKDQRQRLVKLTAKGGKRLDLAKTYWQSVQAGFVKKLGQTEADALLLALQRVSLAFERSA